jgi:hypothetical protein
LMYVGQFFLNIFNKCSIVVLMAIFLDSLLCLNIYNPLILVLIFSIEPYLSQ